MSRVKQKKKIKKEKQDKKYKGTFDDKADVNRINKLFLILKFRKEMNTKYACSHLQLFKSTKSGLKTFKIIYVSFVAISNQEAKKRKVK